MVILDLIVPALNHTRPTYGCILSVRPQTIDGTFRKCKGMHACHTIGSYTCILHAGGCDGRVSTNCTKIKSEPHRLHKVVGARSTMDQHGKNACMAQPCDA